MRCTVLAPLSCGGLSTTTSAEPRQDENSGLELRGLRNDRLCKMARRFLAPAQVPLPHDHGVCREPVAIEVAWRSDCENRTARSVVRAVHASQLEAAARPPAPSPLRCPRVQEQ